MPIYEYGCSNCNNEFEVFQKITEEPVTECPKCHGPVKKLMSNTTFVLKGTGWFATDYSNKSCPNPTSKKKKDSNSGTTGKKIDCSKTSGSDKKTADM